MSTYVITIQDRATYEVEAETANEAIIMASNWFDERLHDAVIHMTQN